MSGETASHSVMEGQGAYNRHAAQQAAGGAWALPLLEQAAQQVLLPPPDIPAVIVDYGSSQGKNSLRPIQAAITVLRQRLGDQLPISVVHTDLPGNDFSSLFHTLEDDQDSYLGANQPFLLRRSAGRFITSCFPRTT
jgi:SAM dependent carboxyl methyltransferase